MKKIILMAGLLIASIAQAQDVTVYNGTQQITDGFVYEATYSPSPGIPDELKIKVTNVSAANLRLKLKMVEVVNATGNEGFIQFCFGGNCYFEAVQGESVGPNNGNGTQGLVLEPGKSNVNEGDTETSDHFFSVYEGDDVTKAVSYKIAVIKVSPTGEELATLTTFTYRYGATLSTNDFSSLLNMGINVKNTVVKNQIEIQANQSAALELFDTTGKKIKTATIQNGSQSIDLSELNTAVYIARFTTEDNKTSQIRIIKN